MTYDCYIRCVLCDIYDNEHAVQLMLARKDILDARDYRKQKAFQDTQEELRAQKYYRHEAHVKMSEYIEHHKNDTFSNYST